MARYFLSVGESLFRGVHIEGGRALKLIQVYVQSFF